MIHINSTVADRSFTKLHDKRYIDVFDTIKSQPKIKKTTLENVSHNQILVTGCLYCTSVLRRLN